MALLEVKNLSIAFGGLKAVDNFQISIDKGQLYGLIGPNGAGKTTVFNLLTGVYKPDAGSIELNGINVTGRKTTEINQSGIARTFQNIRLFKDLSVLDNVKAGLHNQYRYSTAAGIFRLPRYYKTEKKMDEKAMELLKVFGLDEECDYKASNLPYGKQRKLEIARALATKPKLLLLDEPAAGLDVVMRERFYQLLLEDFAQTGRTFLVSTHIIEEAASVFEQVIILDQGRILENSPTEELVEQFRYISGREDVVDQACAGLEVLSVQQMGRHKTAAVRGSDAQFRQARQADVDVSPMNLQNVFVALCGHGDAQ